jgi:hypothetical protein
MPSKFSKLQQGGSAAFQAKARGVGYVTHVEVQAFVGGKEAKDAFDLIPIADWKALRPLSRRKIIYIMMGVEADFGDDTQLRGQVKENAEAVIRAIDEVVRQS